MSHSITFGKALQQLPPLHLRKLEVCRILCRLGDPMPPPSDPLDAAGSAPIRSSCGCQSTESKKDQYHGVCQSTMIDDENLQAPFTSPLHVKAAQTTMSSLIGASWLPCFSKPMSAEELTSCLRLTFPTDTMGDNDVAQNREWFNDCRSICRHDDQADFREVKGS
jgi:hypothetical protein